MLPARPGSLWTARLALVMFVLGFVYLLGAPPPRPPVARVAPTAERPAP